MKVIVFGASGGIGTHVVAHLLDLGHEVTAVVRTESTWNHDHEHVRIVRMAGLRHPGDVVAALAGKDAVISAIGPRRVSDGPVASTATDTILRAMAQAGVARIVAVSAAPVGEGSPRDGLLLRRILRPMIRLIFCDHYLDLARMEGQMAGSGFEWTAIRPPRLSDGPATGRYRTVVGGSVPNGYLISRADAAHAMCAALDDPRTFGQPVGIAY